MPKARSKKEAEDPVYRMTCILCEAYVKAFVLQNGSALQTTKEWRESEVNKLGSTIGWKSVAEEILKMGVKLP